MPGPCQTTVARMAAGWLGVRGSGCGPRLLREHADGHRGGNLVRLGQRLAHLLYHLVPLVLFAALRCDLLCYRLRMRL